MVAYPNQPPRQIQARRKIDPRLKPKTSAEVSESLLAEEVEAHNNPRVITGFASYGRRVGDDEEQYTWTQMDKLTRGLQPFKMYMLAGRPKVGKSMVVCSWLPNIAEQCPADKVIRVFTFEMSAETYQRRVAAIMANLPDPVRIQSGFLNEEERTRYHQALEYVKSLPIEYYDQPLDSPAIEAIVKGAHIDDAPETFLWILDNFGLVGDVSTASNNVYTNMAMVATKFQNLCHNVCTGIIVHHLNRLSAGRRPTLDAIAGSDQLARNMDMFIGLWRRFHGDERVDPAILEAGEPGELVIENRDGISGIVPLWWNPSEASYKELKPEEVDVIAQLFPTDAPKKTGR